jgi:glycosyltransferase involved in cell wall biosynthesis
MAPPSHTGLRLLEVTQRFPPALGGVEAHVGRLAAELSAAGASVTVATTDLLRDRPFLRGRAPPAPEGIPVHRHRAVPFFPAPHGLGIGSPGLFREVLRADVDVVHAHAFGYPPTWAGALARALGGPPLVVTPHMDEGTGTRISRRYAVSVARWTLRRADRVIALTRREAGLLASLGVPPERITVIPNGVDLSEFGARPAPPSSPTVRVLYVGRFYPRQKGLDVLIRALAEIPKRTPVSLRIVGEDWGGTEELLRLAASLGVRPRVEFTGAISRSAVLTEYKGADLFVLPSRFEPFGIVLLEAMAAGLPIVATRVGGVPEVVEEGRTAVLVPPGDPTQLALAIGELARDAGRRQVLGALGRERARQFSWPTLVPQFLRLFTEVAEAGR